MQLAFDSSDYYISNCDYNVLTWGGISDYEVLKNFQNDEDVIEASVIRILYFNMEYDNIDLTDEAKEYLDYIENNELRISIISLGESKKDISLEVVAVTNNRPIGYSQINNHTGYIVVSDAWIEQYSDYLLNRLEGFYNAKDAYELETELNNANLSGNVNNVQSASDSTESLYTLVAVFLYGFIAVISLIGVTNIFNTLTTSMELRSKEFAILRSVGMTSREFNRMVRLESVFYGSKALLIGIAIGSVLSYAIHEAMSEGNFELKFRYPVGGVLIAVAAVIILLFVIMNYSLRKAGKQNIIETIRKETQ